MDLIDNDYARWIIMLVIAGAALIGLASSAGQQPTNVSGSYNTHYETHTTNVTVCGICFDR